eukprot:SAG11_NODE_799_length_7127_cov_3.180279_2_plen_41_part_00
MTACNDLIEVGLRLGVEPGRGILHNCNPIVTLIVPIRQAV